MKRHTPSSGYNFLYGRAAILYWTGFVFIAVAIAIGMEYFELEGTNDAFVPDDFLSRHLISYANLLLISSTFLYIAHLWFTSRFVGLLASGMATLGAMVVTVALFVHWIETNFIHHMQLVPFSSLYSVTTLFSAVTVVLYLAIERVYRTRAAGAFVMPIVAVTVLYQSFLLSGHEEAPGHLAPVLRNYWTHAHILSDFIGHGAFAIAASFGIMYLFRERAEQRHATKGFAIQSLPNLNDIDHFIFNATVLGFSVYTVGVILGVAWSYKESEKIWASTWKEVGVLAVWLVYLAYFYGHYARQWPGNRMAWLVILGFSISIFSFVGLNYVL